MARDVIISAFATPPQAKMRPLAQPLGIFTSEPRVIDVNGIGSDVWMGPTDTARKPREPWGGTPFAREALMYKQRGGGSVLRGLLKAHLQGDEPRRIAVVAFSAGGTFAHKLLEEPDARALIDTVILLDALHIAKLPNGSFSPKDLKPWVEVAKQALRVGWNAKQRQPAEVKELGLRDALLGPLFISAHTAIKQSPELEKLVGNTTASTQAVWARAMEEFTSSPEYQSALVDSGGGTLASFDYPLLKLRLGVPLNALPITIGPNQGVPPPAKTWLIMPAPSVDFSVGNLFDLNYGGTTPADHVFQAWYVQRAIWETFLAPRWNADTKSPVASILEWLNPFAGVGEFQWEPGNPGGNLITQQEVEALGQPKLWHYGLALAGGLMLGRALTKRNE